MRREFHVRFCERAAVGFLRATHLIIGVIGSKAEAREVMKEVSDFLRYQLRLEASPEKSKVSKASKGTVFLGYTVITVTGNRVRRTKLGRRVVRSRDVADRVHLRVPHDRLVRFNQRKGYGDLGRLKAMHRRYLVDSSMLEIVLAYNAEMRGLANYYRLAYRSSARRRRPSGWTRSHRPDRPHAKARAPWPRRSARSGAMAPIGKC